MQTSPGLERSDLDQWVSWVLKVSSENAQPPEQVWPRIVHQIVNLGGTEPAVVQDAGGSRCARRGVRSKQPAPHYERSKARASECAAGEAERR